MSPLVIIIDHLQFIMEVQVLVIETRVAEDAAVEEAVVDMECRLALIIMDIMIAHLLQILIVEDLQDQAVIMINISITAAVRVLVKGFHIIHHRLDITAAAALEGLIMRTAAADATLKTAAVAVAAITAVAHITIASSHSRHLTALRVEDLPVIQEDQDPEATKGVEAADINQ